MILAVDFDGVIHNKGVPIKGHRMGTPLQGAVDAMEDLKFDGHTLVVHTVMARTPGGKKVVEDWLNYYDVPYDEVTAIKPIADIYLDDKALTFTSWTQAMQDIGIANGSDVI